jgi:hypothetical protein
MIYVTMRRDLSIFIKLMRFGTYFIMTLMFFIVAVGIYSLTNTDFSILGPGEPMNVNIDDDHRYLYLFNTNFSPLAGQLGIGYFLHTVSLPITRNNEKQENNERDVFLGYVLVAGSYILVGTMGYIGFSGIYFNDHLLNKKW